MTEITYERRYCLFFDVLGFSSKVGELPPQEIHNVLLEIRKCHNYREVYGKYTPDSLFSSRRVTQFSDCVVVSYKEGDFIGVISIISDVFHLQLRLLRYGFLVRGSVTIGELYHDEHFCFGPALLKAVELEKRAIYPRVVLDDDFAKRSLLNNPTTRTSLSDGRYINNMVQVDLDDMLYIDYFNVISKDFNDDFDELFAYLNDLKRSIINLGERSIRDKNIETKYLWMRNKFNDMTKRMLSDSGSKLYGYIAPDVFKDIFKNI
ncbi:hypothetical protein [Methylocaldum sp. RMAD-M]|jgi:hypothetical protein|uniref:hypothetical protein n=1 Tax=Methylocaldum sp. RMAD-M TaxID=2806557 RepID=UPI001AE4D469|nr:hypothetical protein [Methylocaldum sp. RMAD-M]MBP1152768.1 hypothetical protein [Methylocaldum sp. RMAD-M]